MTDAAPLTQICKTYLAQIEKQKKLPHSTDEMSYRDNLHCVLLTNHAAFHVYADGKRVEQMAFSTVPKAEEMEAWRKLLERFLNEAVPHAHSAEEVAKQLAKRAKDLRLAANVILSKDNITRYSKLLAALRETLAFLPACDAVFNAVHAETGP